MALEIAKAAKEGAAAAARAPEAAATDEVVAEETAGAKAATTVVEAYVLAGNAVGMASATSVAAKDVLADVPEPGAAAAPKTDVPPEAPGAGARRQRYRAGMTRRRAAAPQRQRMCPVCWA